MTEISRAALFGKLNPIAYRSIEAATVFCKMRGNPFVEIVHWLHQLLQLTDSDLHHIVKNANINPSTLAKDITAALDKLPRGSTSGLRHAAPNHGQRQRDEFVDDAGGRSVRLKT